MSASPAAAKCWQALHAPWLRRRILADDGDLLVVDKPPGIAVHGAAPGDLDLVTRLGDLLRARGEDDYLAVHQRLDKDASGVLCFVRARALNRAVAQDFESHAVERRYIAAVLDPGLPDQRRLEHRLRATKGGPTQVVRQGGVVARSQLKVLKRKQGRAWVELSTETGRKHQLRAQLSAIGAPIVGDRLYGGQPGPRLFLHATQLGLPALGRRFELPPPPAFQRCLDQRELPEGDLCDLLEDALSRRYPLRDRTGCFRWVNEEGDGVPGLTVDVYDQWAVLSLSDQAWLPRVSEVSQALLAHGARGVYLKLRKRADLRRENHDELAPDEVTAGAGAAAEIAVHEGAQRYRIRLGEGLSVGLFLDQRDNRQLLLASASGKRVLNLFSYTCSFSVAAAVGGASEVVSVDLSRKVLDWGRANFADNDLDGEHYRFEKLDAFGYLERAGRRGERFDWIVLDPPSFGTRKKGHFSVDKDYSKLLVACLGLLAPGGRLLAVTNHRRTSEARLLALVKRAAAAAQRKLTTSNLRPSQLDFPPGFAGPAPSKSVLIQVE